MRTSFLLAVCAAGFACLDANAYCIHNQLADREIYVEQAKLPGLREGNELRLNLKPGQNHCCRNLDCNPSGRSEAIVELSVSVLGEPQYQCAPEKVQTVKVTGDGLVRVMKNPYRSELSPYIVRIRSGQKDLTGPRGVTCLQKKGK